MKIPFLNLEINSLKKELSKTIEKTTTIENTNEEEKQEINVKSSFSYTDGPVYGNTYPVVTRTFDGEKTLGELGVIQHTIPDYKGLRLRAYDADMRTDLIKIIVDRFYKWVIGSGLKLQSEIVEEILTLNKVNLDTEIFKERLEVLFNTYSYSKIPDLKGQDNLHKIATEVFKTAFLGGDCLVVVRIIDGYPRIQVIDGIHIQNPLGDYAIKAKETGNIIKHGIELDSNGKHIAYWINSGNLTFERIPVNGENSKRKLAWLVYGEKKRVDHIRGVSSIATIIEKTTKLDRFTEATVSKAEQVANLVFAIEHDNNSIGENPFENVKIKSNPISVNLPSNYDLADGVANRINETTSGQALNMPIGSKLHVHQNNSELNYESFHKAIFEPLCATVGIPPEVALQSYNSNYSASRAAINNWGFNVDIGRDSIVNDFYKPILQIFLELEILKGNIDALGFINALKENNEMLIEAFISCRFIGKNMPHIDPLKEVKAIRAVLGDDTTALATFEQACEQLGLGDWETNYKKFEKEKSIVKVDNNAIPSTNTGNTASL